MEVVFSYFVSFVVMMLSVFMAFLFQYELERMFGYGKDVVFHISNVLLILMVAVGLRAMMTIYILKAEFNIIPQMAILIAMLIPLYLIGYFAYEKYRTKYRTHKTDESGKVIVLNEKYLQKKKLPAKIRKYNSVFEDKVKDIYKD